MTPRLKKHHNSEGVTCCSINWVWVIAAEDQWESSESWAYGGWILLSECELQTESCCLHCLLPNKAIHFFFSILLAPEKNSRRFPPPSPWWYFDFSFPFPVYHSLIRSPRAVTCSIQLHLLKRPEMLLSIWNIVQTDCSSSSDENISVYCSEIKPLPQVPATLSVFSGAKKKNLQKGLLIPRLFVLLLQFSKTRLSQFLLIIWTTRCNDKCQEIFILLKLPNPFK